MDKFLQMVLNTFLKRIVNLAVERGVNHFAGKGKPSDEFTPEERAQARRGRDAAKQAGDIAKMVRKIR